MFDSSLFIFNAIRNKKRELFISLLMVLLLLLIASTVMYIIERKAQPEVFKDFYSTMWWAVATLTTVGYGDIYPITMLGKLMGGLIAILGVGLFALPAGIIASGFIEELEKDKKNNRLNILKDKLIESFKTEYFIPVYNKKETLKMENVLRKWMSMNDIKYKLGMTEESVFDVVNFSNHFRLINPKINGVVQAGLEFVNFNRDYGYFKNRNSKITVINMFASSQPFFGHFSRTVAYKINANYLVNERYSNFTFNKKNQLDLVNNSGYCNSDNSHIAVDQVKNDLISNLNKNDLCIFLINASDNKKDLFGLNVEKDFENGDIATEGLFENKILFKDIYNGTLKISKKYKLKLKHLYDSPDENHICWFIKNKTGANVLLIHVNVGFLKKKGVIYYQFIDDFSSCFSTRGLN